MDKNVAAQLANRAKTGDMQAFEELVLAHEEFVYRIVYRILGNEQDAWDVSQETFLRAYQNLNRFDGRSAFSTWLYRIAHNAAIDLTRRRKNVRELPLEGMAGDDEEPNIQHVDPGPSPEEETLNQELRQKLAQALQDLPEDYRWAVILRDLESLSYQEIADHLGLPLGTAKSRVSRGRLWLRKALWEEREPFSGGVRHKGENTNGREG